VDEIPALLRRRLLSVRAYDAAAMMIGTEVVRGAELEPVIRRMMRNEAVQYLHVHNAGPGCYNCRVVRGGEEAPDLSFWHEVADADAATDVRPREVVAAWVEAFNRGDADALAAFYDEDAVNHQVAEAPVRGREAIRAMFAAGFAAAEMTCIVENLFEDGEWAMLEWRDPLGLRGCGFFHVVDGRIVFQRGYWDKLTFLRQQGLPTNRPE
jgi:limonene-1,2-epoxide hydrolase